MQSLSLYEQKNLLCQVAENDVSAFRQLFDLYRTRLYAAALKITKSDYAAEEIVQEVFVSLWDARAGLYNIDNPPAYIFTIAYNKTFRYLKKVASDNTRLQALLNRETNYSNNNTEEWLDLKDSEKLVSNAVQILPPQRQLIYKLSRVEGLSHDEIARQLNISPLTVKKQIVLALQHIRESLSKAGPLLLLFFLDEFR